MAIHSFVGSTSRSSIDRQTDRRKNACSLETREGKEAHLLKLAEGMQVHRQSVRTSSNKCVLDLSAAIGDYTMHDMLL